MKLEEVQKFIEELKPMLSSCNLEVVKVEENKIQLKLACPDMGMFKVQGKIISAEDEVKKNVEKHFKNKFGEVEVGFV